MEEVKKKSIIVNVMPYTNNPYSKLKRNEYYNGPYNNLHNSHFEKSMDTNYLLQVVCSDWLQEYP